MIKKLKRRLEDCDAGDLFLKALMVLLIAVLIICIASWIANGLNEIDSGIVVDKHHTRAARVGRVHYAESYELTIKGEKNGKTVEYRFHCSKDEYDSYNIGDKYPKEEEANEDNK